MYSIAELSEAERTFLFRRQSFSDYAAEVESFEHLDVLSMLRIAEQRAGRTAPVGDELDRARAQPAKYHWMLSGGQCGQKKIDSRFILSSHDFRVMMEAEKKKVCSYCITDFQYR